MKRIFPDYAYGDGPRTGCWWDETVAPVEHPVLRGDVRCDVAIVGAGFTGLSAALTLARAGASVVVLDANRAGWGASGRNGGFCCLGGGMASDASLDRRFGRAGRLEWRRAEVAAVAYVGQLAASLGLDIDRHSQGETCVLHKPGLLPVFEGEAARIEENYGVVPTFLGADQMRDAGMAGPFHGAMTIPVGFGLNPGKLLCGVLSAALSAGAQVYDQSPATRVAGTTVETPGGRVHADRVIVATNGYSSEDIPAAMAARYMPAQSTVLVTRPITAQERAQQGWTSDQMAYDSRNLLHYFRLMPDGRFLFGMRGGLRSSPAAEDAARRALARDFRAMFPEWAGVDVTHCWSGMVCLARNLLPFVGALPGQSGVLAGFAYHGNGVAMGMFSGAILADLALGRAPALYPQAMRTPARRFPFGAARRIVMPPVYAALNVLDR